MTVCDGMGGAAGGREASTTAAQEFVNYVEQQLVYGEKETYLAVLEKALEKANESVSDKAKTSKELNGMGTTLVSALFDGESYYCLWVGDSRIYAITSNGLLQISHDHSFVQTLIDNGSITPDEAKVHPNRNIITKAVGTDSSISGDVSKFDAGSIRGLMLCSDGLCGYVDEDEIAEDFEGDDEEDFYYDEEESFGDEE
jgi:protein phosphatase